VPRHLCILLRRFDSFFAGDVTRGYVRALEARNVPHLLVGGRSYHAREEVETLRAALSAIEWPDDELSVFATLRGSLFAIGDAELLEFRHRHGILHPYRIPPSEDWPEHLGPIREALQLLAALHRQRNRRPIAETLHLLLAGTRAHAGFVLRPSGEQVLANVLHVAEQARGYERHGGVSFRGFVERLEEDATQRRAAEAPVLEEGSEGVRIMTVHRAKGLEFPVVLLADMTANLTPYQPNRWVERERRLCAQRIAGLMPRELLEHADEERAREAAEGVRIAYVAATRARDLLVVPTVGCTPWGGMTRLGDDSMAENTPSMQPAAGGRETAALEGWIAPLNASLYPPAARWSQAQRAPGCPSFGTESVLDPPLERVQDPTVRPGLHVLGSPALVARRSAGRRKPADSGDSRDRADSDVAGSVVSTRHDVVWWDPKHLGLDVPAQFGLRQEELLGKEAEAEVVQQDLAAHAAWLASRTEALERGATPSMRLETVTARTREAQEVATDVEVLSLPADPARPGGPRFGTLVHAVLATVSLRATPEEIRRHVEMQGRILGAPPAELGAAQTTVEQVLVHPLLERARRAADQGDCRRETPLTFADADGTLLEGVVDLAFLDGDTWVIVDFKTDRDLEARLPHYTRQVSHYAACIAASTGRPTRGVLLRI
jgi:ATP-dependent exoDNAse (exonuclease V) beta subunit